MKSACPNCKAFGLDWDNDNLAQYDNGAYCFACGYKEKSGMNQEEYESPEGTIIDIPQWGISQSVCEFMDYRVATDDDGSSYHIANYKDVFGKNVGAKLRFPNKKFSEQGNIRDTFYGQWKWPINDKLFVTIVEGEKDVLSLLEIQGTDWPVWSPPGGAANLEKIIQKNLDKLLGWKYVVFALDNDEAGQKAMKDCARFFEPDRLRIVTWPLKDVNDMILACRTDEVKKILFNAPYNKPKSIVTVSDILERVLKRPEFGKPWPFKTMTDITYGLRPQEIYILVGGNGIGKTEIVKEIVFKQLSDGEKIGLFSFEQDPASTIQRLVGSQLGRKLHIPTTELEDWDREEILKRAMVYNDKLFLYDHCEKLTIPKILLYMRFLAKTQDIKFFVLDNLKGIARAGKDSHYELTTFMLDIQALTRELGISIMLLSHVAKDKYQKQVYVSTSPKDPTVLNLTAEQTGKRVNKPGLDWESGRMPTKENVEGSSAVADLADYVIAIARDTTSDDEMIQKTIRVKFLKTRLDGVKAGREFNLFYNDEGTLVETTQNYDLLEGE